MKVSGYELVGRALHAQNVERIFYIMGAPINDSLLAAQALGVRLIDVRHEQAAAMMAQADARVSGKPGVCMGASGPGTANLTTGLLNALVDCAPVVALGGGSPVSQYGHGSFQEVDQVAIMRPITKWSERVYETRRIPELIDMAFRQAVSGKPGPVFLDLPGDVLYKEVEESDVVWPFQSGHDICRPAASQETIEKIVRLLEQAERPVVISGSGVIWSDASTQLQDLVNGFGVPFYTTPQGRGAVSENHELFFGHARSTAFREADFVLAVGTRLNYVFSYGKPPRFAATAKFVRIDIDPVEIGRSDRPDIGVVGDAAVVLGQIVAAAAGRVDKTKFKPWHQQLRKIDEERAREQAKVTGSNQVPIHPLRLCKEIADFIDEDTIMVVDGQEILNYGRQSIPSFRAGHRLNSGPFGTMGVGLPFAVGAKAARPDHQVVVLHGDGSFGLNAMEVDTAVRHKLPVLIVISLNGGWTAAHMVKPGRDLGYTRYDRFGEVFGCYGEYVEKPEEIAGALRRGAKAVAEGRTAIINVVTDSKARAGTANFGAYAT